MTRHVSIALTLILALTTTAVAQGPIQPRLLGKRYPPPINERITVRPVLEGPGAFSAPSSATRTRISGLVIDEAGIIVPSAGIVLFRSLRTGLVVKEAPVDGLGQFGVIGLEQGLYAAELVNASGTLITSTPSFTLVVGEVVQLTPVVSHSSLGGFASVFGNSTAGALESAVNAGVMAVATAAPLSPVQ